MKIMDFSQANCKNCYKCVRNCSIKAIKIVNDQAQIDETRCIACGDCLVVCPQNARNVISDLDLVKESLAGNKKVVASIAPSYLGVYPFPEKLITALYMLGFDLVEETAMGAEMITEMYKKVIETSQKTNLITSCCPSINLLIEKYYPDLIDFLIPLDSPMVAHSKAIKEKYGENTVVTFIGPCISKKREAISYQQTNQIDAVLTFEEIDNWLIAQDVEVDALTPTDLKNYPSIIGRSYPIENGILKNLEASLADRYVPLKVSGLNACKDLFQSMEKGTISGVIVEANSCLGSCIGGPGISRQHGHQQEIYMRLQKSLKNTASPENDGYPADTHTLNKTFTNKKPDLPIPTEEEIRGILEKIGKHSVEDELNCGACGYDSCREKALAVYQGMSHTEMCIPYMRTRAERMTNTIFDHSPNIIIILDENLNVLEFNPTAEKVFLTSANLIVGHPIRTLIDDEDFLTVQRDQENMLMKKVFYTKYSLVVNLNIMYLPKQNLYMCIMHNMTDEEKRTKEMSVLKEKTLNAAQRVIDKQMRVAQEIASLLGETTAETKVTLTRLQKIVRGEEGELR